MKKNNLCFVKNFLKNIVNTIIWGVSLFSALLLSMMDNNLSTDNVIASIILFLTILIPMCLKIIYYLNKKVDTNINGNIINAFFPSVFSVFFIFKNHIDFGYGHTYGILGYNKQLGFLSMINMTRTTAFILLSVLYIIINMLFIYKFFVLIEKICNNIYIAKKIFAIIIIIICGVAEVKAYISYFAHAQLCNIFVYSILLYYVIYFLLNSIVKLET